MASMKGQTLTSAGTGPTQTAACVCAFVEASVFAWTLEAFCAMMACKSRYRSIARGW